MRARRATAASGRLGNRATQHARMNRHRELRVDVVVAGAQKAT
jgi:hypothetical protein